VASKRSQLRPSEDIFTRILLFSPEREDLRKSSSDSIPKIANDKEGRKPGPGLDGFPKGYSKHTIIMMMENEKSRMLLTISVDLMTELIR